MTHPLFRGWPASARPHRDAERRGNVWIKHGGRMHSQGVTRFLGSDHTFVRNDNREFELDRRRRSRRFIIAQYFLFHKPEATTEMLGPLAVVETY